MSARNRLELWGGVECTVNRVGNTFIDQVELTGHAHRIEDLDRLASLGVRAVRYPILWERTAPHGLASIDFTWADERMARLRALGIRPIVGLVHHGSGPKGTSLLDESFVDGLAAFASRVAARYPWIKDFTPVNEPLTTARFSGLYGHWYPHRHDDASFARALLTETRATIAAMRAIREYTPDARLVQTEDLGRTFATRPLAYQADFENHRRWLSLDLLFGRVRFDHPLYKYLRRAGIARTELEAIAREPCPPDLVGVNYYVTSDRHLDHRLARYPSWTHGTNGRDDYADVEAVRARRVGIVGHERLLKEAWKRYATPVAITEAHLGATPEDQARWLARAWRDAQNASAAAVDVRAVTLWSAFGACDWDSLVTRRKGNYEPGAFDVRAPSPMPTAVAVVARELATHGEPRHPLAVADGWWLRDERLLYDRPAPSARRIRCSVSTPPIVVTGAEGLLGRAMVAACRDRGLEVRALARSSLDVTDSVAVDRKLAALRPWLVIHCAGRPRATETDYGDSAMSVLNIDAPANLARACSNMASRALFFTTAFVFGASGTGEYFEDDDPAPSTSLARQHVSAERSILDALPDALVVRTGPLFGYCGARVNRPQLDAQGQDALLATPAYAPMLANAALDLAVARMSGIVHLAHAKEPASDGFFSAPFDDRASTIDLVSRRVAPMATLALAIEAFIDEGSRLGVAA